MTERQRLGAFAERVAAHRLEAAGLAVLARNARTPSGEIDIVARDGADVAFVEVRARRAAPGAAAESLDARKLRRMWRCAMEYCEERGLDPERARIDLVSLDLGARGKVAHVEHFRGLEIPDEPDG